MTDDREHAERARRIERLIKEGTPFERIFPTIKRETPPSPVFGDGHADFVAMTMDSPHGGTPARSFLLDCQHATVELTLADRTEEGDGEVLATMLETLRLNATAAGLLCLCWPRGWRGA